jgi:hypothetical protein
VFGSLAKADYPQLIVRRRENQRAKRDAYETQRAVTHLAVKNIVRNEDTAWILPPPIVSTGIALCACADCSPVWLLPRRFSQNYCSYNKSSVNSNISNAATVTAQTPG